MKKSKLYYLVENSKNKDMNSMLILYNDFNSLLKKYARKLYDEDAYNELTLGFIKCIYKMPIYDKKFQENDMYIISYIETAIKNQYVNLVKNKVRKQNHEFAQDYSIIDAIDSKFESYRDLEDQELLIFIEKILTEDEFNIFIKKYIYGLTDKQIANSLHISRQAVSKRISKISEKIKDAYLKNYFSHISSDR